MAKKMTIWNSEVSDIEIYREGCAELHEMEPHEIPDDEVYNYALDCIQMELSDLFEQIAEYEKYHGKKSYVVKARLGRWDGIKDGGRIIYGMKNVITACMEDITDVYRDGIKMKITSTHHDGVNNFEIKELTQRGDAWYDAHRTSSDRFIVESIFNDRRKSRHVKLWKELFGV